MRTVIIGSGNVASALAEAIYVAEGVELEQIFARNAAKAHEIANKYGCKYTSTPTELAEADLYIIAVSDQAIAKVATGLNFGDAVVAHTAGSVSMDTLPPNAKHKAVLYPLQTFTSGRKTDMQSVPFMVEGSTAKARETVSELATKLSGHVVEAGSDQRAKLHLAAVFACNFTNYMYAVGEELAQEAGFGFDILKPLIGETAAKAIDAQSPRLTQTGPAVRNDFQTKATHGEMLRERPDLKNLYVNISNNIWETSKKTSQK